MLILDIFAGIVLGDTSPDTVEDDEAFILPLLSRIQTAIATRLSSIPERLIELYAETLRKGSLLYRFDVSHLGGTTAPAIPERSEGMKYWAFDALVSASAKELTTTDDSGMGAKLKVAHKTALSLMNRMEASLRAYIDDASLRGLMPLGRWVFKLPPRDLG